jgi:hypothetical protein
VQQGFPLTLSGSEFVASSVVIINGTTLNTTVTNAQELRVMITTALISTPGALNVAVQTPSGNAGDMGCSSGGTSHSFVLTIT